jgi:hypothetical protein
MVPRASGGAATDLPLISSEAHIDLGTVPAGGQKECTVFLTNRTERAVEVSEVATSCDCLNVDLANPVVPPSGKVSARVRLDLRGEPEFTGGLRVLVNGKGKSKEAVFALAVAVTVKSPEQKGV